MVAPSVRPNGAREPNNNSGIPGVTPITLLLVLVIFVLLTNLGSLVVTVLMALLLGTILEGPVSRLQKRGLPRAAAIAVCYMGVLAMIVALVLIIIPVVQNQATEFRDTFPPQMHALRDDWAASSNPLLRGTGVPTLDSIINLVESPESSATSVSSDAAFKALPIVGSVIGGVASLITTLVITFYYLLEKNLVRRVVIDQLSPDVQGRVSSLWTEVETKVGGWLRGQLILCAIIGLIATIAYAVIGLNFWPLLGLWAGITEIIPIVGPWLGGIPAVLVALTMGPSKAILVALVIVTMQSLENWFLVPRVMRGAVGLTPLTVFVAIIAGTELMGVMGAVLAIPLAAGLQVILSEFMNQRRSRFEIEPTTASSGWRWMLTRSREYEHHIEHDDPGTQLEGQTVQPDEISGVPKVAADEVVFDEAPRMLVDAERGEGSTRAAEATWPTNPWKNSGGISRDNNPWRSANDGVSGNARNKNE